MSLKPLECPNCHGRIDSFDETTKKGFCPFCDYVIVDVPERQSQFAVDAQGHVQVAGIAGTEEQYQRIKDFMHLGEKDRALALAQEFADKHPMDFRGWQLLCDLTLDYALEICRPAETYLPLPNKDARDSMCLYLSHLRVLAQTTGESAYLSKIEKRVRAAQEQAKEAIAETSERVKQAQIDCDARKAKTDAIRMNLRAYEKEKNDFILHGDTGTGCAVAFLAGFAVLILCWGALGFLAVPAAIAIAGIVTGAFDIKEKRAQKRLGKDIELYKKALKDSESKLEQCKQSVSHLKATLDLNKALVEHTSALLKTASQTQETK